VSMMLVANPIYIAFLGGFPDPDPLSETSLKFIKDKIGLCVGNEQSNHDQCSRLRASTAPLRLLAVIDGNLVQLAETDGQHLQYAALSYCWGSSKAIVSARTLGSNLESRLHGFELSSLPQTLQDSVIVARSLSIPYIWIDALCIVQDDSDEWAIEATKMMQYYERAYITIVATIATSADEGFLVKRPSYVHLALMNAWKNEPGRALHFSYPQYLNRGETNINKSTWNSRGWTLQERLLSGRVVFFTHHGTWFECRGANWTDGKRIDSADSPRTRFPPTTSTLPNDKKSREEGWGNQSSTTWQWYLIVKDYMARRLTYAGDRLPAISGIAASFSRYLTADAYLIGLWRTDICRGLLWRRLHVHLSDAGVYHHQPGDYPSWTWCGMNYKVFWPYMNYSYDNCAQLVRVEHEDSAVKDPKSSLVKNTILVMSGCVFNAGALSRKPTKTRVKLRFDDDTYEMDIVEGAMGDFAFEKLTPFSAMILVQQKEEPKLPAMIQVQQKEEPELYSLEPLDSSYPEEVFKAHGILLLQREQLGGSVNYNSQPPVTRRFHRVGVFCIEIVEITLASEEFMERLYRQKDTVEIT